MTSPATVNFETDTPPLWVQNIRATPYPAVLDKIAPGVVDLIESTQASGEPWADTFARLLPQIQATEEQFELLTLQSIRAAEGLTPAPIPSQNGGAGTALGLGALLALLVL